MGSEMCIRDRVRVLCVLVPAFALIPSIYFGSHTTAVVALLVWRTNLMFFGGSGDSRLSVYRTRIDDRLLEDPDI